LPLMHGLLAFGCGDDAQALRLIGPLHARVQQLGGSHAQRDLITQTLLAAAVRGHDRGAGRALLAPRRHHKPQTPLTAHWARALDWRDSSGHA